jgi:hypothetical protein
VAYLRGIQGYWTSPKPLQENKNNKLKFLHIWRISYVKQNIHREVEITVDKIIEELAKKSRQLEFIF